jgi:bifunctional non-homologous end joining protein LigD
MSERSVFLFFSEGGSDKEYHVHLRQVGVQTFMVQYANGPRGKVGQSKDKLTAPVSLEDAKTCFDKLVAEKQKKGYTESPSGVRFTATELGARASGHAQQLPSAIDHVTAMQLLNDDAWAMQEKANGERRTIVIRPDGVRGINKLGLYTSIPETWVEQLSAVQNATLDGEQIGNEFYAFDLIELNGNDFRQEPLSTRWSYLEALLTPLMPQMPSINLLELHRQSENKATVWRNLERQNREGMVFKKLRDPYTAGRSLSALKYKFVETCTVIVIQRNAQRSALVGLLDTAGNLVATGNVTIPQAFDVSVGDLIEIRYLYFNPGGAFEQPVFLHKRADVDRSEATFTQIQRTKPGVVMDADGRRTVEDVQAEPDRPRF